MDSEKRFLTRESVTLPEERPNRLVKDGKIDITTILEIYLYRHGHIVFCRGCRAILGQSWKRKGGIVSDWHPWLCTCSNYDFLTHLDYTASIRRLLLVSCRGRRKVLSFRLSEGSGVVL